MLPRYWLIGMIVAVPLTGIAVADGLQTYSDIVLRREYKQQHPRTPESQLRTLTIREFCGEARTATCDRYANLTLLRRGASATLIVGLGLLVVIWLGGRLARTNRLVLLRTFGPGLYLTAVVTILLIVGHAVVAMAIAYYVQMATFARVYAGVIAGVGIGGIAGIAALSRSMLAAVKPAETFVLGKRMDREQERMLYERVERLALAIGALQPQHIVVGLDPNFFVTEAKVTCINGELTGRTMFCSLSLARILTMAEFDAIIGHELGHYKGLDTQFSKRFYPIYRGTLQSLSSLQAAGDGAQIVALLPAIGVLSFFYEAFSLGEPTQRHSRIAECGTRRERFGADH